MRAPLTLRATSFLRSAYEELGQREQGEQRVAAVSAEIAASGTWTPTREELTRGARMAWRNSNRCIGRLFWKTLKVIDARDCEDPDEVFEALQHHLDEAFRGGDVGSVITVFRPRRPGEREGPRIVNHQLVRFAGYVGADGRVLGDPAETAFTAHCEELGWTSEGTRFDVLPHVLRWPGQPDRWRMPVLPSGMLVPIRHPELEWFEQLGLKWYAVPVLTDMMLEIGGLEFTAAPFNGWYVGTEIGCRNLADAHRYDMLPEVARRLGLDTRSHHALWQDRAMLELNRAVLFSFEEAGVKISHHHEVAAQFVQFEQQEAKHGRRVRADWTWITPPMSASATPVFHRAYDNTVVTPNFFYQDPCVGQRRADVPPGCPFHAESLRDGGARSPG
ncbi:MAG: nitric oxide synthase oxygenase [Deltaproteobacteria bacterium]|jgi:nitric-oxide synthase